MVILLPTGEGVKFVIFVPHRFVLAHPISGPSCDWWYSLMSPIRFQKNNLLQLV